MSPHEIREDLPHLVLLRLSGELATKARATRARFETRLLRNLRDALASAGIEAQVRRTRSRLFVSTATPAALEVLARVAGVQSLSAAVARPGGTLDQVVEAGAELFGEVVEGRRFAVRARRVGERHEIPLRARDVERALGARLLPMAAAVDLDGPEVTVRVELFGTSAYFFSEVRRGPGGLPVGVEGRAVALVSGGFDSAVAAWQMLRRGVALDYVFCNLGGATHQLGVLRVLKVLADGWSHGTQPRLYSVSFEGVAEDLRAGTEARYWQVLLKRLMLRAATRVAGERNAAAIVTGEALGQVSSQTLQNLAVISETTALPILRPLVGLNKEDIIEQARHVGTAELSAVVSEYCAMVARRPATSATLAAVLAEEAKLDPARLERALAERVVFDLRALDPEAQGIPELEIREIPAGAVVIDLRSSEAFRAWHPPDAVQLDFAHALQAFRSFARDRTYVVCCEFGLKSAHLAESMRREGLQAFHVPGGVKTLRHGERKPNGQVERAHHETARRHDG